MHSITSRGRSIRYQFHFSTPDNLFGGKTIISFVPSLWTLRQSGMVHGTHEGWDRKISTDLSMITSNGR
ncbi:hypothetical protein EYC80_008931 [Monilinia laxa]|uniref:Uncharacterized protein n=1 Tax=Monilinia laxa TaxID=61186 RepID=A0A5N6K1Z8_MONLA|nr:hypothetical protein EYC80_008931 [Monilinia laxa]